MNLFFNYLDLSYDVLIQSFFTGKLSEAELTNEQCKDSFEKVVKIRGLLRECKEIYKEIVSM